MNSNQKQHRPSPPSPLSSELRSNSYTGPLSPAAPSSLEHINEANPFQSALHSALLDEAEAAEETSELEAYREKAIRKQSLEDKLDALALSHPTPASSRPFEAARPESPIPDNHGLGWPGALRLVLIRSWISH